MILLNITARCLSKRLMLAWLVIASILILLQGHAEAWGLAELLLTAPSNGKLAKYAFTLNEKFPVTSVAVTRDGRLLADSSTQSNSLNIWNISERRVVAHIDLPAFNPFFHTLTFSPDGELLALCDGFRILRVYGARTGRLLHSQGERGQEICSSRVAFSDDGAEIAVLGKTLSIFNTIDWTLRKSVDPAWFKGRRLTSIAFMPRSFDLILGGGDHFLEYDAQLDAPFGGVYWRFASSDLTPQRRTKVYDVTGGRRFNSDVISMAVSPNGKVIATGARTGAGAPPQQITDAIKIVDVESGRVIASPLSGESAGPQDNVVFASDGTLLISEFNRGNLAIINIIGTDSWSVVDSVNAHGQIYDVAASQGGEIAAAIDHEIVFWKLIK